MAYSKGDFVQFSDLDLDYFFGEYTNSEIELSDEECHDTRSNQRSNSNILATLYIMSSSYTFNLYMSEILLFCIQTLFMNSFLDNQFYIHYKLLCVSQFRLAFCFFSKFFQAVFVFTFNFCVILQFLYPCIDRSEAYCFTVVRLSVCRSVRLSVC